MVGPIVFQTVGARTTCCPVHPLAIVGLLLVLAAGCATAPLVRGSSDSLSQLCGVGPGRTPKTEANSGSGSSRS